MNKFNLEEEKEYMEEGPDTFLEKFKRYIK